MEFELSPTCELRLAGCHPELIRICRHAAEEAPLPFIVFEGLRSVARQRELVAKGVSKTYNSRHLTGHAVDIVPVVHSRPIWNWDAMHILAPHIKAIAAHHHVRLDWGGDWKKFPDGAHWELSWKHYPLRHP